MRRSRLLRLHETLYAAWGPQRWWPRASETNAALEIALGAVLTQNTAWRNVERALANLRRAGVMNESESASLRRLASMPARRLEALLRPSGYFRQKATRVRALARHALARGGFAAWFRMPKANLRRDLLSLHGVGPETADSIALYAAGKDVFVVDAYTKRILSRHGFPVAAMGYEALRAYIEARLPRSVRLYNEFHALLVRAGNRWCKRRRPKCSACPLRSFRPLTLEEGVEAA